MHLLFATPAFPPFHGGGERYAGALAAQLIAQGHRVTVVTSAAVAEPDLWLGAGEALQIERPQPGLTVLRLPLRPVRGGRGGLLAWRKGMVLASALPGTTAVLRRMARRIPPLHLPDQALAHLDDTVDLVHGFNISWEYAALWGAQLARARGWPFVFSPFAHLGSGPRDRVAFNSTMRHQIQLLDEADAVLALTETEIAGLRARGVRAPRMVAVGSGLEAIPPLPHGPLPESEEAPYVLFIGRASHDKGALHAAQAVLRLRAAGTAVRLLLIGRETGTFTLFLESLSPEERQGIVMLGPLTDAEKHAYLARSVALLLPSHSDSFGIVLLEAWAHGKPVVAARAGGIPGVVDEEENGLLVPFGDVAALARAIRRLLDDPDLRGQLGAQGRAKLNSRYRWESVAAAVLETYTAVLGDRAGRPVLPGAPASS